MADRWYGKWYFMVQLVLLLIVVTSHGFNITINNEAIKNMTNDAGIFVLTMDENNHHPEQTTFLLFTINDVTGTPAFTFMEPTKTFKYKISQNKDTLTFNFTAEQVFDFETQPSNYRLMDNDNNIVILNINNIDDEPPTLTSPMCNFKENFIYDIENTTCTCNVSDPDGWLDQMNFTIVNSDDKKNESKIFEFKYKTPPADNVYEYPVYIIVNETLDYETITFYSFNVTAKDGAGHATTPNENVRTIIYVDDVNDMPPEWQSYVSTTQFEEESSQIFYVVAVDGDKEINAKINYTLSDENREQCIKIDPHNGTITVSPIDRDARDIMTYKYKIIATEEDIPAFNTSLNVTYYIEDIDDNAPLVVELKDNEGTLNQSYPRDYVEEKVANFQILENYNHTSLNLKINVTDIDTGENARFDLALVNYNTSKEAEDFTSAFYIVPNAGYRTGDYQITVKNVTKLDYEVPEWDHIKFYVHSTGTKDPKMQDKLLVNIDLIDYNDEIPKFAKNEYEASINETLGINEFIVQVLATDRDAEDKILKHEILGSQIVTNLLKIESDTGKIFVGKASAFDYDKINPVFVQVKATDKVGHTAIVPVTINLLDVNNKAPTIDVVGVIRVDENQPVDTLLNTSITASDVDTTRDLTASINWDASYAMKNSQKLNNSNPDIFKLIRFLDLKYTKDTESGSITIDLVVNNETEVIPAPDFETFDTLYLSIIVTDLNTDPDFVECCMSTTALITVNINDINDNPPIFTEVTLAVNRTAYENADKDIIVGSIVATDADVGDKVTYDCKCLDPVAERDWFFFNESSGEITVRSSKTISADNYPKEMTVEYNCTATDQKFYTPQVFSIYIIDKNNKNPNCTDSFEDINIDEQSSEGALVTKINTTDDDRDIPFHTVQCTFYNANEECYKSFYIDPETNNVIVKIGGNDLNRDNGTKQYPCSVRCVDNPNHERNEDQLLVETNFTIKLNDINNNPPELLTKEASATENLKKNGIIATIEARDIDSGVNSQIDFSIEKVYKNKKEIENKIFNFTETDNYWLNDTIKRLTLVALEDLKDHFGEYTIYINMTDRGIPMQQAEGILSLTIDKFNFYAPSFIFPGKENKSIVLNLDQKPYSQLTLHFGNQILPDLNITDDADGTCSGKWNTTFNVNQVEPSGVSIFSINSSLINNTCSGQLQVNNYFNKDQAKQSLYKITLSAKIKEGEPISGEKPFTTTHDMTISFFDVDQDPVFNQTLSPWTFIMAEDDDTLVEELPEELRANYPNVPEDYSKFYFLHSDDKGVNETFKLDVNTGAVSLQKSLTFLEIRQYRFQIMASKDQTGTSVSSNQESYLDVIVNVNETNRHTPQWNQSSFYGAIMSTYPRDTKILTISAFDLDELDQGMLSYKRNSSIERSGSDNIYNVNDPPFLCDEKTGDVTLNFPVDNSMSGYFWFNISVEDIPDWKGNGPHINVTNVTIYIISEDKNMVGFRFGNSLRSIIDIQEEVIAIISENLGSLCYSAKVDHDHVDGQDLDNQTLANIYCIQDNTPISSEDILKKLANLNTFQNLRSTLMNNCSVWLLAFSTESDPENLEETLKAALVGVSVILGTCCVILGVTFFLKTKQLNRRLKKLTEPQFGSDESDLNRKGLNGVKTPNTNANAVEGSNPVFNIGAMKEVDFGFDKSSIHSGDSDLIGIEDRPEFDFFDSDIKDKERF